MAWTVEFAKGVERDLRSLSLSQRQRVVAFLTERVANHTNPRTLAKKLHGREYEGLWRFRVGDLRLIAEFQEQRLVVMVIEVGKRGDIYR